MNGTNALETLTVTGWARRWMPFTSVATGSDTSLDHLDPDRERIAAESLQELVGELGGTRLFWTSDVGVAFFHFALITPAPARSSVWMSMPMRLRLRWLLRSRAGSPGNWRVIHRSILDPDFAR